MPPIVNDAGVVPPVPMLRAMFVSNGVPVIVPPLKLKVALDRLNAPAILSVPPFWLKT